MSMSEGLAEAAGPGRYGTDGDDEGMALSSYQTTDGPKGEMADGGEWHRDPGQIGRGSQPLVSDDDVMSDVP
jgi:hypothetical protein